MKIARVRSYAYDLKADEPLAGARPMMGVREMVLCKVVTADGVEGIGVAFFGGALTNALAQAVHDLGQLIVGEDPRLTERCLKKMRAAADSCGPGGILTLALSAIDTALWDIRGKLAGQPVARLLGGHRDTVPTYASGALHRFLSLKEVETAARTLVERGWTSMKMQLALPAHTSPEIEVERIKVVRAGGRPRYPADVRHQPALDRLSGDRHRQSHRGVWAALARGRDDSR